MWNRLASYSCVSTWLWPEKLSDATGFAIAADPKYIFCSICTCAKVSYTSTQQCMPRGLMKTALKS